MTQRIQEKLLQYIQEAVAMEESVAESLRGMIETTDDAEMRAHFERHLVETDEQARRLRLRSDAHDGTGASLLKEFGDSLQAAFKGLVEMAHGDRPARNARDAFATEHLEIATYELLERVATLAGDHETAAVARGNRAEEEAMARVLGASWDTVATLTLREEGVAV